MRTGLTSARRWLRAFGFRRVPIAKIVEERAPSAFLQEAMPGVRGITYHRSVSVSILNPRVWLACYAFDAGRAALARRLLGDHIATGISHKLEALTPTLEPLLRSLVEQIDTLAPPLVATCRCDHRGIVHFQAWDHHPTCAHYRPAPTSAEQLAEFDRHWDYYEQRLEAWKEGGRVGPPPPRPVRPHTPGPAPVHHVRFTHSERVLDVRGEEARELLSAASPKVIGELFGRPMIETDLEKELTMSAKMLEDFRTVAEAQRHPNTSATIEGLRRRIDAERRS